MSCHVKTPFDANLGKNNINVGPLKNSHGVPLQIKFFLRMYVMLQACACIFLEYAISVRTLTVWKRQKVQDKVPEES